MYDRRDLEATLETAEAFAAEFEDYLLSDRLYRQLTIGTGTGKRVLKMSAGSLLETLGDLTCAAEAGHLAAAQADRLRELSDAVSRLSRLYATRYRQKLARELKSQIDSWRWFLQDCLDDPTRCRDEYPFEVRIRNRIELLTDALGEHVPAEQMSRLQELDRQLRGILLAGDFILDAGLRDRFPRDRYWWLYGQPGSSH